MPHRYQAPVNTTAVFASTREIRADKDGVILLADNAPLVEHQALLRAGCVLLPNDPVTKPAKAAGSAAKAKPAGDTQKAKSAPSEPENGPGGDVSAEGSPPSA